MLEKDLVADIKKYLKSLGSDIFFWKEHGSVYGTNGVPDIICCYKGRFLGMECKLSGGVLTELQKRAIEKINKAGGIARRVESVEDAKAIIRQADEERERVNAKGAEMPVALSAMSQCLNSYQRAELALQYEPKLAAEAKERMQKRIDRDADEHGKVNEQLGQIAGVSRDTIRKVRYLLENADGGTKKQLQEGDISVHRAYTELLTRQKNREVSDNE